MDGRRVPRPHPSTEIGAQGGGRRILGTAFTDTKEEMGVSLVPHSVPSSVSDPHLTFSLLQAELREFGNGCLSFSEFSVPGVWQEGNLD